MSTYETDTEETDTTTDTITTAQEEFDYVNYQSVPTYDNSCETVEMEEEESKSTEDCPTCTPNPSAPAVDWTKRDDTKPFLNERKCTYSITLRTK